MEIIDFLPAYPELSDVKDVYSSSLFPEGLYQSIYDLKEFRDQTLTLDSSPPDRKEFKLQKHQIFVSRYMSDKTPYGNILIFHGMGTGKTLLAVSTIEDIISNPESSIKGAVVFLKNKSLISNFVDEIKKLTRNKYFPSEDDFSLEKKTKMQVENRLLKNIKKNYNFQTFEAFANQISPSKKWKMEQMEHPEDKSHQSISDEEIKRQFSNKVIILDEVHHLRVQPNKSSPVNKAFKRFLHLVENCIIIIMTGTPMIDKVNEIADLMNLILPLDKQMPTKKDFDNKFIKDGKLINIEELKSYLYGNVSSLRSIPSSVPVDYVGEKMNVFKYYPSKMSEFQSKYYYQAVDRDSRVNPRKEKKSKEEKELKGKKEKDDPGDRGKSDEEGEGFHVNARHAANFVFPDGSYGEEGFQHYSEEPRTREKKERAVRKFTEDSKPMRRLTPELIKKIKGVNDQETLNNLRKYSCKFASTIEQILYGGNTYVYNEFVSGCGAILFARILELFGYSRTNGNISVKDPTSKRKRYAILTSITLDNLGKISEQIKAVFNDPKNSTGEYIQVIIGSRISGEALSYHNIQQEHIHTPFWNYAGIDQAIYRGRRYLSHNDILEIFEKEGKPFQLKIYHHVAVPIKKSIEKSIKKGTEVQSTIESIEERVEDSIDYIMYEVSEDKDLLIKQMERLLRIMSVDCALNRQVNMLENTNYPRDCDYTDCRYKCENISDYDSKVNEISYQNYYIDEDQKDISNIVKLLFRREFEMTLSQIKSSLPEKYNIFTVISSLKRMIDRSEPIINKYGFKNYLQEYNDIYFLVDTFIKPSSNLVSYYTKYPKIQEKIEMKDLIKDLQYKKSDEILRKISSLEIKDYQNKLPGLIDKLSIDIQELLLENAIDVEEMKEKEPEEMKEMKEKEPEEMKEMKEKEPREREMKEPKEEYDTKSILRQHIIEIFKSYIHQTPAGYISTLIPKIYRCRKETENHQFKWYDCTDDEKINDLLSGDKKDDIKRLEDNKWEYYGIYNPKVYEQKDGWMDGFWIRDMKAVKKAREIGKEDKRLRDGLHCGTGKMSKGKLIDLAFTFGIDMENEADVVKTKKQIKDTLSKIPALTIDYQSLEERDLRRLYRLSNNHNKDLCTTLKEWFQSNDLLEITDKTSMKAKYKKYKK